jgi:exopolysaccharide production protein ExoQ
MGTGRSAAGPLGTWLALQLPRLEYAVFAFLLALGAGALGFIDNRLYAVGTDFPTHFSTFTILSWPAVYLLFAAFMLHRPEVLRQGIAAAPWVFAFPLVAALSVAWSMDRAVTTGEAFRLVMTVLIGVYLGARLSVVGLARLTALALGVAVGASVLLHLAGVDFATMINGAARGVFYHKNTLGNAAVVLIAAATALLVGRPTDPLGLLGLVAGLAALPFADSATAIVTAGIVLAGTGVLVLRNRPLILALWVGFLLIALALVVGFFLALGTSPVELLFGALDKDPTLTGRSYLWETGFLQLEQRPVLGTGFAAFWTAAVDWRTLRVLDLLGQVGHFHNTLLEIAVELGLVGVVAALATLGLYTRTAWRHLRSTRDRRAVFAWLFLFVLVATGLTEVYGFVKHSTATLLLVALAVAMGKELGAFARRR